MVTVTPSGIGADMDVFNNFMATAANAAGTLTLSSSREVCALAATQSWTDLSNDRCTRNLSRNILGCF